MTLPPRRPRRHRWLFRWARELVWLEQALPSRQAAWRQVVQIREQTAATLAAERQAHTGELAAVRAQLDAAVREAADARRHRAAAVELLAQVIEAPEVEGCTKVRLRTIEDAWTWARQIERETGQQPGALRPYRCTLCPRQPISSQRFLHVRHADRERRGLGIQANGSVPTRGQRIGARISEELAAELRRRAGDTAT